MDDFAAGEENDDSVTRLYYELVNLISQIRLPMAQWATNSEHLKEVWRTEGMDFKEITQTLGIEWDTKSETFLMDPRDVMGGYAEGPTTKRQVLQVIARFNPFLDDGFIRLGGRLQFAKLSGEQRHPFFSMGNITSQSC